MNENFGDVLVCFYDLSLFLEVFYWLFRLLSFQSYFCHEFLP